MDTLDKLILRALQKDGRVPFTQVARQAGVSETTIRTRYRKLVKLGIVRTDAQLFATMSFAGGEPQQIPQQPILDELDKQYDVEQVDATNPISPDDYDVLMVVQPSSLGPEQLENLLSAIRAGMPTAIFEDPAPIFLPAPGTGQRRQPPGGMMGMMGMGGGAPPKGDITRLWRLLGIDPPSMPGGPGLEQPDLAWQQWNPYPKIQQLYGIPDTWVFASTDAPGGEASFNEKESITAGLREVFFPVPGAVQKSRDSDLNVESLVKTGTQAGRIRYQKYVDSRRDPMLLKFEQGSPTGEQTLAVRITGAPLEESRLMQADEPGAEASEAAAADDPDKDEGKPEMNVVYVADIDLMMGGFLQLRASPGEDPEQVRWNFENVTFLLNIIDVLSGDDDYVEIRKRRPHLSTLKMVENATQQARDKELEERLTYRTEFNEAVEKEEEELQEAVKEYRQRQEKVKEQFEKGEGIDIDALRAAEQELRVQEELANKRLSRRRKELERDRDKQIRQIQRSVDEEIRKVQFKYKAYAVSLPPIPPLLVALFVFVRRRLLEREGVSRERLR